MINMIIVVDPAKKLANSLQEEGRGKAVTFTLIYCVSSRRCSLREEKRRRNVPNAIISPTR